MDLLVLSSILSFLDINEFQDCDGDVVLLDLLGFSVSEIRQILFFWLSNTCFKILVEKNTKWTRNSKVHRSNDKPAVIEKNREIWVVKSLIHRRGDKPAYIWRQVDRRSWFLHGKIHRDGGLPAIEDSRYGDEWWVHGVRVDSPGAQTQAHATFPPLGSGLLDSLLFPLIIPNSNVLQSDNSPTSPNSKPNRD